MNPYPNYKKFPNPATEGITAEGSDHPNSYPDCLDLPLI